jgi:hypothetical protein
MDLLQRAMTECGPWLYPVFFGSVVVLAIILERAMLFFFRWNIQVRALLTVVEKLVVAGNIDRALKLARVLGPSSPVGRVVLAGLERVDQGSERARLAMDEAFAQVRPSLHRRLFPLLGLGLATFAAGLLGTYQLGGFAPHPGVPTPLPLAQPMSMAPFMAGAVVGTIATLAFVALFFRVRAIEYDLTLARQTLLRLVADRGDRRPPPPPVEPALDALPRLGRLGLSGRSGTDGPPAE